VLEAALAVLLEGGTERFSIAEVAARADVHETSIYRRWRTRENLIVDAMLANSQRIVPIPDTGAVRDDLVAVAESVAAFLSSPVGLAFVRAGVLSVDDEALATARSEFWSTRGELASVIISRGVERGEVRPGVEAALVLQTLIAPLYMRVLVTHTPIGDDLPERLADLVYDGIRRAGS
jgi:AcrR family transcriptional regulator